MLFEAIQTDSPQGPIASRLAKIGETMCGDKELWFSEEQESFDNHAERFANVPPGNSGIVTGDASIVHSTITAQTHKEIGKAPAIGREDDSQMRNRLMHGDAA
ncbi:hypothetical protein WS72_13245 [Burkholderia savannae]|uniref:Uncharacterized protein n=1 Tax=Burkholderia savannae TaxID=1637837 RepID=A0ABR5TFP5_9BURK|nr:hypothetical protein WS72_13245 [Burkholderia savannae]